MRKEIKVVFNKQDKSYTICYYLHGTKATMQFVVRCPTKDWHYYLPIDLGYHADNPQYSEQTECECTCRDKGFCYYDGTSLGTQELWDEFEISGDEETIWNKLTEWMNERFKE